MSEYQDWFILVGFSFALAYCGFWAFGFIIGLIVFYKCLKGK